MSKSEPTDDLLRRLDDLEREAWRIRTLVEAHGDRLPGIVKARLHCSIDDMAATLTGLRQTTGDAATVRAT